MDEDDDAREKPRARAEEKKKDSGAEMRRQLIAAAVADLVRRGHFGDHNVAEDGLPLGFQIQLLLLFIPDSPYKKYWDLFIVILVLWNCVMVPLEVAFDAFIPSAFDAINNAVDVMFFFDIVANFRTARINDKDELDFDPARIARNYVSGKWFYIDVVSTIPWELFFASLNTPQTKTVFKLLSCIKMVRLLRLSKFFRWLNKVLGKYANGVRIFQLFFIFVLAGHWVGCLMYLIELVIIQSENSPFAVEDTFMEKYALTLTAGVGLLLGNTGYSDMEATELFQILAICLGTGIGGVIIGHIASIITGEESVAGQQRIKADSLSEASVWLQLPTDLRLRVAQFHEYTWTRSSGYVEALDLPALSSTLRSEIVQFLYAEMKRTSPFFSRLSPTVAYEIIRELQQMFFAPADVVCNEGSVGDRMFFLTHGQLELASFSMGKKKTEILKNKGIWGGEVLADVIRQDQSAAPSPWDGRYFATGLCHSYCDTYVLLCESVSRILLNTSRPRSEQL